MKDTFSLVLCEGYDDRAFVAECLERRLGWEIRKNAGPRGPVRGGDFGFRSPSGAVLLLRPCRGLASLRLEASDLLDGRKTAHFDRLVLILDGDKGGSGPDYVERARQSVGDLARGADASMVWDGLDRWTIDDGAAEVRLVLWHASGLEPRQGIPNQQCLERLVCAAAAEVWPAWATSYAEWLRGRPGARQAHDNRDPDDHKTMAASLRAGWFSAVSSDEFYREIWRDPALAAELERRLRAIGAWATLEACAAPLNRG